MTATDSRPRVKYILPDGRPILVIHDHGQVPKATITFELRSDDVLWDSAQRIPGSQRRIVAAHLAVGM